MHTTNTRGLALLMLLALGSAHCAAQTNEEEQQVVNVDVDPVTDININEVKKAPPPKRNEDSSPPKDPQPYMTFELENTLVTSY